MALYGAIETRHGTEQYRAYLPRNILRDRHLEVNLFLCIQIVFVLL